MPSTRTRSRKSFTLTLTPLQEQFVALDAALTRVDRETIAASDRIARLTAEQIIRWEFMLADGLSWVRFNQYTGRLFLAAGCRLTVQNNWELCGELREAIEATLRPDWIKWQAS